MCKKKCSVEGCERKHFGHGLCEKCYRRARRKAIRDGTVTPACRRPACSEKQCGRPAQARGLCEAHYRRAIGRNRANGPIKHYARNKLAKCEVIGCTRKARVRGKCSTHYYRYRRLAHNATSPVIVSKHRHYGAKCEVANCNRKATKIGMCDLHYWRQRNGVPLDGPIRAFRGGEILSCALCAKHFVRKASELAKGGTRSFCSVYCYHEFRKSKMPNYKQRLARLKELRGQSGLAVFDRITEAVALRHDREYIDKECDGNEITALDRMDRELKQDLFEGYSVLSEMLAHFPDREKWKHGNLTDMRQQMIREKFAEEQKSRPPKPVVRTREQDVIKQVPKPIRSAVTSILADSKRETAATRQVVAKQQQEIDYRKQEQEAVRDECLTLRKEVETMKELLAAKDREIASLHRRIEALEGQRNRNRELATA